MKTFGHSAAALFLGLFLSASSLAVVLVPNLPDTGVIESDNRGAMNPEIDYEKFSGRVSDKDDTQRVLKIQVENNNTKFFRTGDLVLFKVNLKENLKFCRGFVRDVEDFHFTIYVETFRTCYPEDAYFKRGTVLNFTSKVLAQRIYEATRYREQLIVRKDDFLKQMNDINNFLWTFDQQKVKVAADYDERINQLQREKRKAIDDLISLKQERLILQNELSRRLNELDGSLKYYRVERQELMTDRWHSDHDQGLPMGQRPQEMRNAEEIH